MGIWDRLLHKQMDYTAFASRFSAGLAAAALRGESKEDLIELVKRRVECKFCKTVVRPCDGSGKSEGKVFVTCSHCHRVWITIEEGRVSVS